MAGFTSNILADVNALIDEIDAGATKKASAQKKAEEEAAGSGSAGKDPGGYMGKTTHPSGKADAGTQAAPVGFRGKENSEDVKKEIPHNVEEAAVNKQDSDYDQYQVGTKKAPTGEDPSTEDAYKGDKDDSRQGERGGTAGPFNAEEVGEKYSSLKFPQLYKIACDKANGVLAKLANGEKTAASKAASNTKSAASTQTQKNTQPEAVDSADAAQAGYELAKIAAAFGTTAEDESVVKFAAAKRVVEGFIAEGFDDADATGEYLHKLAHYQDQFSKRAEGEMPPGMPGMPPGMPPGGDPMAGGGDPTGGEPGPGAEMPPDAGGGDPMAGGGGAGGGMPDEAINELANAFIDAGIPVEKLIAALQSAAGGGGGGEEAPPEMGAEPGAEAGAGPLPEEAKAAAARLPAEMRAELPKLKQICVKVANHLKAGKFKMKKPANAKVAAERVGAVNYLNYIREVFAV